jgi:hypothetical protein
MNTTIPSRELDALCAALAGEAESAPAINALFKAIIGDAWESPGGLATMDRLWGSDSVIAAIEGLQEAIEGGHDTTAARQKLLAKIAAEITLS